LVKHQAGSRGQPHQSCRDYRAGLQVIKSCQPPLNGTLFYSPPAGEEDTIGIGFNLDNPTSIAQHYKGHELSGDYFAEHTISLTRGEVQTLQIVAKTTQYYCEFTLKLIVVSGSTKTTETITDDGAPFRVTAIHREGRGPGPLSYYQVLYVGGVAPGAIHGAFTPQNPATYAGG